MTTPYPQTPGDRREDHAEGVAAAVAAVWAQAELVIIAAISSLARKTALGLITRVQARRKLAQTVTSVYQAAQPKIQAALDQAAADTAAAAREAATAELGPQAARIVPAPDLSPLAASLGEASATAAKDAGARLDAAIDAGSSAEPSPASGPASIFRATSDAYRYAVEGAVRDTRGGAPYSTLSLSRVQAAQKALDDLAAHGITGFTDSAGRNWDLASYVEMATRTAVSNSWDDLLAKAAQRGGLDLAEIYTHSTEGSCPHCLPWLGRTVSLTGSTAGYPSLAEAKVTGFRHPSCRCFFVVLGAGAMQDVTSPVPLDQAAEAYKASQRQRALERRVRAAHRQSQAAITPQARTKARRELATATRASAEHRQRYGVRVVRYRRRESLGAR